MDVPIELAVGSFPPHPIPQRMRIPDPALHSFGSRLLLSLLVIRFHFPFHVLYLSLSEQRKLFVRKGLIAFERWGRMANKVQREAGYMHTHPAKLKQEQKEEEYDIMVLRIQCPLIPHDDMHAISERLVIIGKVCLGLYA